MALPYKKIRSISPISKLIRFTCFKSKIPITIFYSKYVNGEPGQGITKARDINTITDIKPLFREFEVLLRNLKPDEELAIHSLVESNGIKYHLPQIDFSNPTNEEIFESLRKLQNYFNYDIYLFKSGRSYHAYFDGLLNEEEWKKFLAKLILLNRQNLNIDIVDVRWVGWSLDNGFSALRLSKNTPLYLSYPEYLDKIPKKGQSSPTFNFVSKLLSRISHKPH
ncbi:MAG: hypothetical protein WBP45_14475 [Daejeonella sp.]